MRVVEVSEKVAVFSSTGLFLESKTSVNKLLSDSLGQSHLTAVSWRGKSWRNTKRFFSHTTGGYAKLPPTT